MHVVEYSTYTTTLKLHFIQSALSVKGRLRKKTTCNTRHYPPCLYFFSSTDVHSPLRLLTPPVVSFRMLGRLFRAGHTVIWSLSDVKALRRARESEFLPVSRLSPSSVQRVWRRPLCSQHRKVPPVSGTRPAHHPAAGPFTQRR